MLRCMSLFVKVFYYLGELDDALTYALGAGDLFDISEQSDYVNALLCKPSPQNYRLISTSELSQHLYIGIFWLI